MARVVTVEYEGVQRNIVFHMNQTVVDAEQVIRVI
jgi:hypothetical protein